MNDPPRVIENPALGNSIEERAKFMCRVCGELWATHTTDPASTCNQYRPKPDRIEAEGLHALGSPPSEVEAGEPTTDKPDPLGGTYAPPRPRRVLHSEVVGFPDAAKPTNGHQPTRPDPITELGRKQLLHRLQDVSNRLRYFKMDVESIPDLGKELDGARIGLELAGECVERNIKRLVKDS